MVIEACKEYALSKSTSSSSKSAASTPPHVINSVVHLLESSDRLSPSTSTSTSPFTFPSTPIKKLHTKLQCNHCSFVYNDGEMGVVAGSICSMCDVGDVHVARVGAAMSPLVFRSAVQMKGTSSSSTSTSKSESTSTTSESAPTQKRIHIPDIWPPGKNCDICRRIIAIKYCTSCNNISYYITPHYMA